MHNKIGKLLYPLGLQILCILSSMWNPCHQIFCFDNANSTMVRQDRINCSCTCFPCQQLSLNWLLAQTSMTLLVFFWEQFKHFYRKGFSEINGCFFIGKNAEFSLYRYFCLLQTKWWTKLKSWDLNIFWASPFSSKWPLKCCI